MVTDFARAMALLDEVAELLPFGMQARAVAKRRAVFQAIVEHLLDPETGVIVVTDDLIAARATTLLGLSKPMPRSTAAWHRTAIQATGVLQLLQQGASAEVLGTDRNRAPSYALTAPPTTTSELATTDEPSPVDKNWNLSEGSAYTRTEDISPPRKERHFSSSDGEPTEIVNEISVGSASQRSRVLGRSIRRDQPGRFTAKTRAERLAAAEWLLHQFGWGSKKQRRRFALTDEELLIIFGPYFAAGWSAQSIMRGLEFQPDGLPFDGPLPTQRQSDHPSPCRIRDRDLAKVLTWRLAQWRDKATRMIMDPPVEPQQPPRGRPRREATDRPVPARPPRGTEPETALALLRARLTADAARAKAKAAATKNAALSRADEAWDLIYGRSPAPNTLERVYLRAATERQDR